MDVRGGHRAGGAVLPDDVPGAGKPALAGQERPGRARPSGFSAASAARSTPPGELADIEATLVNEIERVDFRELLEPKLPQILAARGHAGRLAAVVRHQRDLQLRRGDLCRPAGYGVDQVLLNIVVTGWSNLAFTFVAIHTVERLGRRKLMLAG